MLKHCYIFNLFLLVLFCCIPIFAQDSLQTPPGFPLGVFSHIATDPAPSTSIQLLEDAGINYIVDGISEETDDIPFKLIGHRPDSSNEYIFYYTKGYYTRWEAENVDPDYNFDVTGFKHTYNGSYYIHGSVEEYQGATCWATDGALHSRVDTVLWGPDYRQDKYYTANFSNEKIFYTADYRMALSYDSTQYADTDTVCLLKIIYRRFWKYGLNWGWRADTLKKEYITISQFPVGTFKSFPVSYNYPNKFHKIDNYKIPGEKIEPPDTSFRDDVNRSGIEFQLDWFGQGKLYIDYIDLYDNIIGSQLQNEETFANEVRPNLISYANSFSSWPLEYWYVNDEPNTMDSYEPMRIVDSIVTNYASFKRSTITEIYPHWQGVMNGDPHLQKFVDLTKPKQLMIDRYPFWAGNYTATEGLTELRKSFQQAHDAQAGFWYVAQAFSERLSDSTGEYCQWRRPDSLELNASVMLALAHGSKGIFFWHFSPNSSSTKTIVCGSEDSVYLYFDGIVDANLNPTDLYHYLKDGLSPRLKGKLSSTLNYGMSYYWHAGLFNSKTASDNKYFLLTNLRTNFPVTAKLIVSNITSWNNLSFRDVEGGSGRIDTTINYASSVTVYETMPTGEGRLYQVAPVVIYSGTLTVNDTINSDITLIDDMTIRDSAELIVEDDYTISGTVTLEGTGFIAGDGYIYLSGNGVIITDKWEKSLFRSKSSNHPKIIWGEYPSDTITVTGYKVYAKYGSASWQPLAIVGDTVFSYTDETVTITQPGGQAGSDAQYKVTAIYGSKSSQTSSTNVIPYKINGDDIGKRVSGKNGIVLAYKLEQNYPNPFNPATTISYGIKYDGQVKLVIYDILGGEVLTLVDENKQAGNYRVDFDASSLPSGIYFYKLTSGRFTDVKKMILIK